jgi:hypothetical protein
VRLNEAVEILDGVIQVLLIKGKDDDELRVLADGLTPILQSLIESQGKESSMTH